MISGVFGGLLDVVNVLDYFAIFDKYSDGFNVIAWIIAILTLLIIMAMLAYFVNTMIDGANYLYMARPEAAPSVLDILPPNFALRIIIMAAVITLMFGLAYLPWHLKDKKEKAAITA